MNSNDIEQALIALANPEIAQRSQGFFKTGQGEYAEGDIFLGIRIPTLRQTVNDLKNVTFNQTSPLLMSNYHEVRLFSLLHMVQCFKKADEQLRTEIYHFYLANSAYVNNWDLVDSSAHLIVGPYLADKNRDILITLSQSKLLWDRRIAILSCFHFIKNNEFDDALHIFQLLLNDQHDLIHKAVGWMLREIGKRDKAREVTFLDKHYQHMPRTMLRYAIEKFSSEERQEYLKAER